MRVKHPFLYVAVMISTVALSKLFWNPETRLELKLAILLFGLLLVSFTVFLDNALEELDEEVLRKEVEFNVAER